MCASKVSPILLIPFLFLSACNNDPKPDALDEKLLTGRWEISQAWRNGKPIETLADTYYEFYEDGTMLTNLSPSGIEESTPFKFSGKLIKQQSEPQEMEYTIEELTDSTLQFTVVIRNFPFRLRLKKAAPQPEIIEQDTI